MMKKDYVLLLPLLMCLLLPATAQGQRRTKGKARQTEYAIGFYNLENLFDTCHDEGKNDYEFLPDGTYKWTAEKYTHKLENLSRVLSEMGTDEVAAGCAAIGVAEVENAGCLADLCRQPRLSRRGYRYVHVEGPDQRGIDCALLYNPRLFTVRDYALVPYIYILPQDSLRATRGFLVVSGTLGGEHTTIVVCHLPSRGAPGYYREEGARQLRAVKDSLLSADPQVKLLIMGDMNDDPQDVSMADSLGARRRQEAVGPADLWNPWWDVLASGHGTLTYQGAWNLFDQIILSPSLLPTAGGSLQWARHHIFSHDYLLQHDGPYRGSPLRTHAGGHWLNGYSDHLPTVVYLRQTRR